jgi:hypothetical protein
VGVFSKDPVTAHSQKNTHDTLSISGIRWTGWNEANGDRVEGRGLAD